MASARRKTFGTMPDGQAVDAFTLSAGGLELTVMSLGASVTSLRVPDSRGNIADVVLGFDDLAVYDGSLEEWTADPALPMVTAAPSEDREGDT